MSFFIRAAAFLAALLAAPVAGIMSLAALVDGKAGARAERIVASAAGEADFVAFASRMTAGVHRSFSEYPPADPLVAALHRARPYWTNDLVPAFLRPREGALDLLVASGDCDAYARALVFVLGSAGVEAAQLNLVSRRGGGHSVTMTRTGDGRTLLLDPQYALVALQDGAPIGPERLRALSRAGEKASDLWRRLEPDGAPPTILENFDYGDMVFARQGQPLRMVDTVSLRPGEKRTIGAKNGAEVGHADLAEAGLYVHWHYFGSRYDRSWVRVMKFEQDTKVVIRTTERPRRRFVTTSKEPRIEGAEIVYTVPAGEALTFADGAAGRDWLRLRSYQDIDAITFVSLERETAALP